MTQENTSENEAASLESTGPLPPVEGARLPRHGAHASQPFPDDVSEDDFDLDEDPEPSPALPVMGAAAEACQPAASAPSDEERLTVAGSPFPTPQSASPVFHAPVAAPAPPLGAHATNARPRYRKKGGNVATIVVCVLAALFLAGVVAYAIAPWPCTVTVNGKTVDTNIRVSLEDLVQQGIATPKAGDFVAIDGSLIDAGEGAPFDAKVNGQPESNFGRTVAGGDVIEIADGSDVVEKYSEEVVEIPAPVTFEGTGAVHRYTGTGQNGARIKRTGEVSGKVKEETTPASGNEVVEFSNVDTGGDKVIALTFDDGPWKESTEAILDVLAANEAKATFFTVGERVAGLEDVVRRERDEGHQVCTHSWDHADGSGQGVNLDFMSEAEQFDEIQKGQDIIAEVTGAEASSVVRVPGGNYSEKTASIISPLVSAEIGWNIDTRDWTKPGAEVIYENIMKAEPGDILLMHDGGGDRSQTVQALRDALPELKAMGYRFITIDELLGYAQPGADQQSQEGEGQ